MTEWNALFPTKPDWDWMGQNFRIGSDPQENCCMGDVVRVCRGRLVYLATPYTKLVTDDDGKFSPAASIVAETRAAVWVGNLAVHGISAFSPILNSCQIGHVDSVGLTDPLDDAFWTAWCQPFLSRCDVMVVPPLDGWDTSNGVWGEVCWALQHKKPVYLIKAGAGG